MSKVLVDRELLELLRNFTFLHDDGFAGAIRGNIDKTLAAQPAEAEGVRDYLTELAEGEVEAKTAIEELQDALSAVTAERDRLLVDLERAHRATNSECMDWAREYERRKEVQAERDQLRAEVEGLREALEQIAAAERTVYRDGYTEVENDSTIDCPGIAQAALAKHRAAMAAKEA